MSPVSMTFGRPARHDFHRFLESMQAGVDALVSWPAKLQLWMDHRNDANMSADDVLALAQSLESTDPSFAADLRGAVRRASPDPQ